MEGGVGRGGGGREGVGEGRRDKEEREREREVAQNHLKLLDEPGQINVLKDKEGE